MNNRVKALWIDALKGGEYAQAKGYLKRIDTLTGEASYCCLGVLCDLAIKDGVEVEYVERETSIRCGVYDSYPSWLPRSVQDWAGLTSDTGKFDGYISYVGDDGKEEVADTLMALNDGAEYNFSEIADVIEERF